MRHNDNTIEAYTKIKQGGLLKKRQWEAYNAIYWYGPLTRNELDDICITKMSLKAPDTRNPPWSRRLAELERMGVIKRIGSRACNKTNFNSDEWEVTDQLPEKVPPKPRKPRANVLRAALDELGIAEARLEHYYNKPFGESVQKLVAWLSAMAADESNGNETTQQ